MDEGAYGAGKAGAPFDPQAFVQKPTVIVRAVCWVCTIHPAIYRYMTQRSTHTHTAAVIYLPISLHLIL